MHVPCLSHSEHVCVFLLTADSSPLTLHANIPLTGFQ